MTDIEEPSFTGFAGSRRIERGGLSRVAGAVKRDVDRGEAEEILIFDDADGRTIEIDFRGSEQDVQNSVRRALTARGGPAASVETESVRKPGRPKLGVVAREVTLLPRHWQWLGRQPGGASVALRRLVEEAAKDRTGQERRRQAQEAAYRFVSALAGDRPHYEEATRALFAGDAAAFAQRIASWPADVRDYALLISADAFGAAPART
jgi:uncharacterized protein